jgi:hypothetical protein
MTRSRTLLPVRKSTPAKAPAKAKKMPATKEKRPAPAAREALPTKMDFETFLSKLAPRDRLNVERHAAALEADPAHLNVWKRVAVALMSLAPHAPKTVGQQSIQYFIPDGKYRMQVFALHDGGDMKLLVFAPNVLQEALKAGLLTGESDLKDNLRQFSIADARDTIIIEELDGKSTEPAVYYKDMLGWNRKAIRMTILTTSSDAQVGAVEALCALAAKKWPAA